VSDIYRGQACYPDRSANLGKGPGNPPFEWVTGRLGGEIRGTAGQGKTWIRVADNMKRAVWTATLVLVAEDGSEQSLVTPRGKILREAETLITGDRNKNYGSPTENFDTTAALWNAQMGHKLKPGESFTGTDVALLMVQLKMARLKTSPSNRDHYLDIAGYIACGWECQEVEDASA
jgi:hypothetical protein